MQLALDTPGIDGVVVAAGGASASSPRGRPSSPPWGARLIEATSSSVSICACTFWLIDALVRVGRVAALRSAAFLLGQALERFAAAERLSLAGEQLLVLLESRLDNVVYRLGFATTRAQARQFVRHGHVLVNGRRCDIPSRLLAPGDIVSIRDASPVN